MKLKQKKGWINYYCLEHPDNEIAIKDNVDEWCEYITCGECGGCLVQPIDIKSLREQISRII
jgi:hypothetical protein